MKVVGQFSGVGSLRVCEAKWRPVPDATYLFPSHSAEKLDWHRRLDPAAKLVWICATTLANPTAPMSVAATEQELPWQSNESAGVVRALAYPGMIVFPLA